MNLKLKRKNSLIILLLCSIMLVSCGQENAPANKLDISKEKNDSARTPEIIENSSLPTQNQKKSKEIDAIYGKWKFTKRISYPKAYSKNAQTLCDNTYLGRTIEIKKELFQGKTFKIENPFYNMISISNPYELMSGYGYLRNSVLKKYIPKEEKYNFLELLENRPENKDNDLYINFEDECYQDNDIWTLLVIDDDTMIFFEDGCFEVKKIAAEEPTEGMGSLQQ